MKINLVWHVQNYVNPIIITLSKQKDLHYLFLLHKKKIRYISCIFSVLLSDYSPKNYPSRQQKTAVKMLKTQLYFALGL